MNRKTGFLAAGPAAAAVLFAVTLSTPASAVTDDAETFGLTDPAAVAKVQQLQADGVDVISASQADYKPTTTGGASSQAVTPQALPSGCHLSVIIYRTNRVITGSMLTSCNFGFTAGVMTSTMTHYNPDWHVWDSTVATGRTTGAGRDMAMDNRYNCNNGNSSNYRYVGTGQLVKGKTTYSASAYDTFDANQPCGT